MGNVSPVGGMKVPCQASFCLTVLAFGLLFGQNPSLQPSLRSLLRHAPLFHVLRDLFHLSWSLSHGHSVSSDSAHCVLLPCTHHSHARGSSLRADASHCCTLRVGSLVELQGRYKEIFIYFFKWLWHQVLGKALRIFCCHAWASLEL